MKKLLLALFLLNVMLAGAQSITITSPTVSAVWNLGNTHNISWGSVGVTNVNIEYSPDFGSTWISLATNVASPGSYSWTLSGNTSLDALVRVASVSDPNVRDQSNRFYIGPVMLAGTFGDTTICKGGFVQLKATGTVYDEGSGGVGPPPPPPSLTYSWSPVTGLDSPNIDSPVAQPVVTTTYIVTVSDGNGQSATAYTTVNVLQAPSINLQPTHATANYFITDSIVATVTGNVGQVEWLINGQPATGTNNSIKYNYPGEFECIAFNSSGCSDTAVIIITGGLTFNINSNTNNYCWYDSSGAADIFITGGTGNYTYLWSDGETTKDPSHLATGTYILTVHDDLGNIAVGGVQIGSERKEFGVSILEITNPISDTLIASIFPANDTVASYLWNNGVTSNTNIIQASGIYRCTITDIYGCSAASASYIEGLQAVDDYYSVPGITSSNLNVLANDIWQNNLGLRPKLTYISNPTGGNTAIDSFSQIVYTPATNFTGADSFYYVACLFDSGIVNHHICDTAMVRLVVVDSIVIHVNAHSTTCPNTCDGGAFIQLEGVDGGYNFVWSNGAQELSPENFCAGSYTLTVSEGNASASASVIINAQNPQLQVFAIGDTVYASLNSGNSSWTFTWSTGQVDTLVQNYSVIIAPVSGSYCVTASNPSGCSITNCETVGCVGCVWPGDADDNGVADNNDLLPIGLGYGNTGSARVSDTISWVGLQCADWPTTQPGGLNYKYADCNGNGIINADDTLPILLNYGLRHLRSGATRKDWKDGDPALLVTLSPDTVSEGQTMTATLSLGTAAIPASNVYGLAFTFNYNPLVVDSSKTQISFGNSWFGTSSNKISMAKDFASDGKFECAITGIDHLVRTGSGTIGTATFVITTDNINGKDLAYYSAQAWISDLRVIDNQGNVLSINEGQDSTSVAYIPTAVKDLQNVDLNIKVYPNPVHDQLIIQSDQKSAIQEVIIIDLLGQQVVRETATHPYQTVMDVSSLSKGAYFVKVKTGSGTAIKPFVVTR